MAAQSQSTRPRLRRLGPAALAAIGRQEWLDRPSYRLEHVLSFAFNSLGGARNTVMNALNGVWLGHPAHPPLASLTSGALGTTVVLDALSILPYRATSESGTAARFARRSLGIGILASVGSAVTGVTDWQHTHESDRRVGLVHGAINVAATALYAQSWWDRLRGRNGRGMALTALGYAVTVGGSYLGGALVFDSGIGVDRSGRRLRTTEWTSVLPAHELNGKPVRVEVDGVGLVVCQTEPGRVSAFGEFCPHLAAPMADGWVDRGRLVCPWHGSWFATESGDVLRGPSAAPLPCYQARVVDGMIEVRGEDPTHSRSRRAVGEGSTQ
jgi:nitrite reductase/ring-hydroxylating ferredoxin subunit